MTSKGFTLIELILVIIVLGILAVTVTPKFFSKNGFSEYAYRTDIIAKLRLIQTRAMQQVNSPSATSNKFCHQVQLATKQLTKVLCSPIAEYADPRQQRATSETIASDDNVTFSPAGLIFAFDAMGRPSVNGNNRKIEITITGEQALQVIIESEGYIHAS